MERITYEQEIVRVLHDLDDEALRDVLGYVRTRKNRPPAEPGWKAVQHVTTIAFPKQDLEEMERAIEEACEEVEDFPEVNLDE